MELLDLYLPVLLYVAGIILLIVLIVLGIKLIKILDKVDKVVDNVETKVNSLNTLFEMIDKTSNSINTVVDSTLSAVVGFISGIFNKKNIEEDYYEEKRIWIWKVFSRRCYGCWTWNFICT